MGRRDDGEVNKLAPGDPRLGQTTGPISSLRQVHHRHPPERSHLSLDAQLLFWRSNARGSLTAEGSWRSASFRYLLASSWKSRSRDSQGLTHTLLTWGTQTKR
jgi:hypothetical protein